MLDKVIKKNRNNGVGNICSIMKKQNNGFIVASMQHTRYVIPHPKIYVIIVSKYLQLEQVCNRSDCITPDCYL